MYATRPIRRILLWSIVTFITVIGAIAVWGYVLNKAFDSPGSHIVPTRVYVKAGSGIQAIADNLYSAGVIGDRKVFIFGVWLNGDRSSLMAGEYLISARATPNEIMEMMISGKAINYRLTIPEGLTSQEIVKLIDKTEGLKGEIIRIPLEGTLLPETYFFRRGDSREGVVQRMKTAFERFVEKSWKGRSSELPLATLEQAVTLASIVEKETSLTNERGKIAGVFINRIRKNMRLQSDPTVIYAITGGLVELNRDLRREDLNINSLFNTYMHKGLPPGPITNPGRASIEAVLNPTLTDALYFVASPDGGHAFASTLAEHNKNVEIWRKYKNASNQVMQK